MAYGAVHGLYLENRHRAIFSRLAYALAPDAGPDHDNPTISIGEKLAIFSFSNDEFRELFSWRAERLDGKTAQVLRGYRASSIVLFF